MEGTTKYLLLEHEICPIKWMVLVDTIYLVERAVFFSAAGPVNLFF